MFFGMYNSLGMLQQMMNVIFSDMLLVFLIIYMDDLLITTRQILWVQHIQKMQEVLQRLWEHGLWVKVAKCTFFQKEVEFLEMWISSKGVYEWMKERFMWYSTGKPQQG